MVRDARAAPALLTMRLQGGHDRLQANKRPHPEERPKAASRRTKDHRPSALAMISSQRLPSAGSATLRSPPKAALRRFEG